MRVYVLVSMSICTMLEVCLYCCIGMVFLFLSGTGILLAVTIIYQYYEMFEKVNTDPNAFVA